MAQKNIKNNKKGRIWAFVAYPESAPSDWIERLRLSGLKIAISPLHDADLNADESEKKPHWHIIAVWENPTTYNVALGLAKKVKGTNPIRLEQIRGYYRYLSHEDNPEKAQYDKNEIIHLNSFNIADFIELTRREVLNFKNEIVDIIEGNDLTEYYDLIMLLKSFERADLWEVASNNTLFFNSILKSRRHKRESERQKGARF